MLQQPEQRREIVSIYDVVQRAASDPAYRRILLSIARRREAERSITPEDIIQTATEEALRRAPTIKDTHTGGKPENYFLRLIDSRALDNQRRARMTYRHGSRSLEEESERNLRGTDGILVRQSLQSPSPGDHIIQKELAEGFASAFKKAHLSEIDQEIFLSRHLEGLGHEELAERYEQLYRQKKGKKLTDKIVKASLHRTKRKLYNLPEMKRLWEGHRVKD